MSASRTCSKAALLLGGLSAVVQLAHAGGAVSPLYTWVSTVRSGPTTFDHTYRITVRTDNSIPTSGVATVTSSDPVHSQVIKGTVVFGCPRPQGAFATLPNQTYTSNDTFTIRQNGSGPFNQQVLSWVVGLPSDQVYSGPKALTAPPDDNCDSNALSQIIDSSFLSKNGLNATVMQACTYYTAIHAISGPCITNPPGRIQGGMTFDQWRQDAYIDGMAPKGKSPTNAKTYQAVFINKVDLNLTRDHHSVSYPSGSGGPYTGVSSYVCNHTGPSVPNPSQSTQTPDNKSIDVLIAQAINLNAGEFGKNLVACVAMDFRDKLEDGTVLSGAPYVRFLLFTRPDGTGAPVLSTTVDLDGRGPKFMPGACTSCHGGSALAYAAGNVFGSFLPYDSANFEFSSAHPHTAGDQEIALFGLNYNVLQASPNSLPPNPPTVLYELLNGWYPNQVDWTQPPNLNSVKTNNLPYVPEASVFVPPEWSGYDYTYVNGFARACRTCHSVILSGDFSSPGSVGGFGGLFSCAVSGAVSTIPMPHSLVAFNRYWSGGTLGDNSPYQAALLGSLVNAAVSTVTGGSGGTPTSLALTSGSLVPGQLLSGTGITDGTFVVSLPVQTSIYPATYTVNQPVTVAAATMISGGNPCHFGGPSGLLTTPGSVAPPSNMLSVSIEPVGPALAEPGEFIFDGGDKFFITQATGFGSVQDMFNITLNNAATILPTVNLALLSSFWYQAPTTVFPCNAAPSPKGGGLDVWDSQSFCVTFNGLTNMGDTFTGTLSFTTPLVAGAILNCHYQITVQGGGMSSISNLEHCKGSTTGRSNMLAITDTAVMGISFSVTFGASGGIVVTTGRYAFSALPAGTGTAAGKLVGQSQ